MNYEPAERSGAVHARAALAAALLLLGATTAIAQASDAKASDVGATAVAMPISPASGTVAVAGAATRADSQAPDPTAPPLDAMAEFADEPEEFDPPPLRMGDATQGLLAWQRSGEIASSAPRPISGSVASRSYDRYLKSFEHPIPDQLGSTVTKSGGGGGASSGSR